MNEIAEILGAKLSVDVISSIIIGVLGFVFTVIALVWIRRTARRWRFGAERENVAKHWADVEALMKRGDVASHRLAVIQADAVLELALKVKGFPGATTGERLKLASRKHRELKKTFWARSVRNKIVHEAGTELPINEARRAIAEFEDALVILGAI